MGGNEKDLVIAASCSLPVCSCTKKGRYGVIAEEYGCVVCIRELAALCPGLKKKLHADASEVSSTFD